MAKNRLIRNSITLTLFSLLMRLSSIAFSIYMTNKAGAEGVGLHQLTLSAFMFAVTLSCSGVVTSVTRVITEEAGKGRTGNEGAVLRSALKYTALVSLTAAGAVFFASDFIAGALLHDERAALPLRILSFALPMMGFCSCFKGYMLSVRRPIQNAVSDVIEQVVEIGTFALYIAITDSPTVEQSCAAISLGITLSEVISTAYLAAVYVLMNRKKVYIRRKSADYSSALLKIALPVTGSACLASALRTVENVYIPQGLCRYGMTQAEALSVYGRVRGMTIPLIFLPFAFMSVLTALLLPEISEAKAAGRTEYIKRQIERTIQFTIILSLPAAAVFMLYAPGINELFYCGENISTILVILAPLVPLMYFDSVSDGILKGLGEQNWVLKCNMADSAIRLVLVFTLIPKLGFLGFMIVMYVSNIFNPVLSIRRMLKMSGVKFRFTAWVVRPLFCTFASAAAALLLAKNMANGVQTAAGMVCFVIVYGISLWAGGRHNKALPIGEGFV